MHFHLPACQYDIVNFIKFFGITADFGAPELGTSLTQSLTVLKVSQSSYEFPSLFSLSERRTESHHEFQFYIFFTFARNVCIQATAKQ